MDTEFDAPAPGYWALDRSHFPGGVTPLSQWLLTEGVHNGFRRVFAELGLPADTMSVAFVHGFMYTRLRPLIGADRPPRKAPPAVVLGLVARAHPEFRRRNHQARATLRDRPSNDVVVRWETELRPRLIATNRDFQNFDPTEGNDADLQRHLTKLIDQLRNNFELHFWLHGHDLGPIARYLNDVLAWGLDPNEALGALAGASPSTAEPIEQLVALRRVLDASPEPVRTLDDLRAISPEARVLLDAYLADRGNVLSTGYDLDSRTLNELPDVVLASIRAAEPVPDHRIDALSGRLRNAVPQQDRATFDERLADARRVMDMRDDNGPLTVEWPMGLLRRALLEAGRRLEERGAVAQPTHVLELTPPQMRNLFGGTLPDSAELAARAAERTRQAALDPPTSLGPPEPDPPLDALPDALAELTAMVQVAQKYIGMDGQVRADRFAGVGIGDASYVGRATVAASADDAIDRLEPGDVLVVRATSPAFNAVLAIAGAVVTADGGVLSHAAVLARELGIPAVIGVADALTIADGTTVEVDPVAGMVRVVSANGQIGR